MTLPATKQALVTLVREIAGQRAATPAQVALAWLLAQAPWIVPIPGTTKLQRLEENLSSVKTVLTEADLQAMDSALSQIRIIGERYPEALKARVRIGISTRGHGGPGAYRREAGQGHGGLVPALCWLPHLLPQSPRAIVSI
mgnify:CR=1 FL=1